MVKYFQSKKWNCKDGLPRTFESLWLFWIYTLQAVFGGKLKKFEGYDYYHQAFKPLVLRDLPGLAFPQWISAISASFTNIVSEWVRVGKSTDFKHKNISRFVHSISIGLKQWFPSNSKDDVRNPVYTYTGLRTSSIICICIISRRIVKQRYGFHIFV